jgi:AmmeMemoRadiSam system protein A
MWHIGRRFYNYNYKIVRISQSGMNAGAHYDFGRIIAEAAENTGRRVIIIASGDLSHKLSKDAPYGFAPEGEKFDKAVTDALSRGNFAALFDVPENIRERAAECGYNSYIILAGCLDKQQKQIKAELFAYECPFGVGYASAGFYIGEETDIKTATEQDCYLALARRSLEFAVRNNKIMPLPDGLPLELTEKKAGVFVSLHKNGRLRGCIGTIAPVTENIASEIIQNAVSAGLRDSRFEPVGASELPFLVYKVDVLLPPEIISDPGGLDVKRYGVIVSSRNGNRRGLLLPNLEGVDTIEDQIDIARQKADIPAGSPVRLERFEVIRHE